MRRYRGSPDDPLHLSESLLDDLAAAFAPGEVPHKLLYAMDEALLGFLDDLSHHALRDEWMRQFNVVKKVRDAARQLQAAIKDADEDWTGYHDSPLFLPHVWRDAGPCAGALAQQLDEWLDARQPAKRTPGQPHPGRRVLRDAVFCALEDCGLQITGTREGAASAVLAAVFREADRIERRPPKKREEFDSESWGRWVKEYRALSADFHRFQTDPSREG